MELTLRYLHFANITIDTHNQLLVRNGETIKLAPKVYDVLLYCCQNAQRIISKDELMDEVWSGTLVTDNAISRTLAKVRKALDDDPKEPKFIVTVPRKGYRMLASITELASLPDDTIIKHDSESTPEASSIDITQDEQQPSQQQITPQKSENSTNRHSKGGFWQNFLVAIIGLFTIVYLIATNQTKPTQQQKIQPLTREVGEEQYPAMSPDNSQLAYTKMFINKPSYINIEQLNSNKKVSIIDPVAHISRPQWTPDGTKLAFLYKYKKK